MAANTEFRHIWLSAVTGDYIIHSFQFVAYEVVWMNELQENIVLRYVKILI